MSAVLTSLNQIAGDLKTVYSSDLTTTYPDSAVLQKRFPMQGDKDFVKIGANYSALIGLQLPGGFSFLGDGGVEDFNSNNLTTPLAGQTKPALVSSVYSVLPDNVSYFVLTRANTSDSPQAIMNAMTLTGEMMATSHRNMLEITSLMGQQGLGAVSAAVSGSGPFVVTLDPATTSPGILAYLGGANINVQFMQSDNTTARTANQATASSVTIGLNVSAVNLSDPANPTVTLTATGATGAASITTGDLMYFAGARGANTAIGDANCKFYEQIGLGAQLSATTGTMFGIDKAAFLGWQSNQLTSVGQFSPSVLMKALALVQGRGAEIDSKYIAVMSPLAYATLNASLATNEIYNQGPSNFSVSKKTGTDAIVLSQAGLSLEVVSHPFCKQGTILIVTEQAIKRIGSVDLSFKLPGQEDEYFQPIIGQPAIQRQSTADWQVFVQKPNSCVILTGVTY